ncbi:TPA: hypothetical protein ON712_003036, partial [Enterococcus faecalis]|nr:hypothetical protein [Enterococcus faecalis]HAP4858418.1 hypothetical protein [Enterococcus faecalis]HCR3798410.1 hypothetical protein [Enterococcus faecalis]
TIVPVKVMKECFEKRLLLEQNLDTTVNNFDSVVSRLNNSMITLFDVHGEQNIGVSNPSVNDFLKPRFENNNNEQHKIRKSLTYFEQLKRCYKKENYIDELVKMTKDHSIENLKSTYAALIQSLTIATIARANILDSFYIDTMHNYLLYSPCKLISEKGTADISTILYYFINEEAFNLYRITEIVSSIEKIKLLLEDISDFETITNTILALNDLISIYEIKINEQQFLETIEEALQDTLVYIASIVDISEYDYEIGNIIEYSIDSDGTISDNGLPQRIFEILAEQFLEQNINNYLEMIESILDIDSENIIQKFYNYLNIDVDGLIQSYLDNRYEMEYETDYRNSRSLINDIEAIFEREIN